MIAPTLKPHLVDGLELAPLSATSTSSTPFLLLPLQLLIGLLLLVPAAVALTFCFGKFLLEAPGSLRAIDEVMRADV